MNGTVQVFGDCSIGLKRYRLVYFVNEVNMYLFSRWRSYESYRAKM